MRVFFQAEDGIRDRSPSRGLGDVYKRQIPLCALAAILVFVAWNMGNWREFLRLRSMTLSYKATLLITFFLTVIFDLTVAVQFGLVVACVFFLMRMNNLTVVEPVTLPFNVPDTVEAWHIKGALFFGSVSNGVLAKSKCPVLMLRDKAAPQSDALKVGIAVDGSKYGRAAVRYALKHISLFGTGAQFYLINVVSDYAGAVMPDMAGMALPALSEEEVLELQKDEFNEAVEPLRPLFAKAAVATKEICLVGNAGDEIAAFAKKKKLDLVVMGSHGYGRFKAAVMGSTATLSLIHISEPTRRTPISYAVFCLKKKKNNHTYHPPYN